MFIAELLFALAIAFIMTALLIWGLRRANPVGNFFLFLLMLFLLVWATGTWVQPIEPLAFGVSWIPMLVVGLIFVFLFAALIPADPRERMPAMRREAAAAEATIGWFFWLLMVVLVAVIFIGLTLP
jgi:hypothetical protein